MGISFKSSGTKTKLVEKVVEARSNLNTTWAENTGIEIALSAAAGDVINKDSPRDIVNFQAWFNSFSYKSGDYEDQFYHRSPKRNIRVCRENRTENSYQ